MHSGSGQPLNYDAHYQQLIELAMKNNHRQLYERLYDYSDLPGKIDYIEAIQTRALYEAQSLARKGECILIPQCIFNIAAHIRKQNHSHDTYELLRSYRRHKAQSKHLYQILSELVNAENYDNARQVISNTLTMPHGKALLDGIHLYAYRLITTEQQIHRPNGLFNRASVSTPIMIKNMINHHLNQTIRRPQFKLST